MLRFLSFSVLSKYENQITIFADYLEEFPDTDELVWILGKQHLLKTGKVWLHLSVRTQMRWVPKVEVLPCFPSWVDKGLMLLLGRFTLQLEEFKPLAPFLHAETLLRP